MELAQNCVQWQALILAVLNLWVLLPESWLVVSVSEMCSSWHTDIYLSPILLQTWLEDSVSIQGNLSLKYESLGGTKQDRTSCNIRVISKVPTHSCYFMPFEFTWLEAQFVINTIHLRIKIYKTCQTNTISLLQTKYSRNTAINCVTSCQYWTDTITALTRWRNIYDIIQHS